VQKARRVRVREVLVFGRTPERATAVVVTSPKIRIRTVPQEGPASIRGDFYGITVGPPMEGARINWLDENGRPGSRGIRSMPRSRGTERLGVQQVAGALSRQNALDTVRK
jgi:hypothetical protein